MSSHGVAVDGSRMKSGMATARIVTPGSQSQFHRVEASRRDPKSSRTEVRKIARFHGQIESNDRKRPQQRPPSKFRVGLLLAGVVSQISSLNRTQHGTMAMPRPPGKCSRSGGKHKKIARSCHHHVRALQKFQTLNHRKHGQEVLNPRAARTPGINRVRKASRQSQTS